ncbi:MAG TPA: SDR family oxidoreductase [Vulgatibacter sp.]|nr:SDR family oxidoreductase [Vulgatibacter sp.]
MAAPDRGTKRVVVTGGGSGIGRAVALRLARAGGSVVVVGRRPDRLAAVAGLAPGRIQALPRDLGTEPGREGLLARCKELMGGLDGLVHAAGIAAHRPPGGIDEASLRSTLEVNLVAPLRLGEQALEQLEPGGGVVFVSSTLALRPIEISAAYSAAKAGMDAAMKSLALAGAAKRIRFNSVAPGLVDTEMIRELRLSPGEAEPNPEAKEERVRRQVADLAALAPLGRLGAPDEIAAAVVHLLAAPWTTGSVHVVDGGLLLRG